MHRTGLGVGEKAKGLFDCDKPYVGAVAFESSVSAIPSVSVPLPTTTDYHPFPQHRS